MAYCENLRDGVDSLNEAGLLVGCVILVNNVRLRRLVNRGSRLIVKLGRKSLVPCLHRYLDLRIEVFMIDLMILFCSFLAAVTLTRFFADLMFGILSTSVLDLVKLSVGNSL